MNTDRKSDNSVQIVHEEIIHVPIRQVFPLACPVMEYMWIPGWKCELLHCPHGYVEKGTVFNEIMSAPFLTGSSFGKTTWTAILHQANEYRVHYQLENKCSSALYKIEMKAIESAITLCRLDFSYKTLSKKGGIIMKNKGAEKIGFMLGMLSAMLKNYTEQGKMLTKMAIKKKALRFEHFSGRDKFRLLLNEIAIKNMKDNDRERFLSGLPISKSSQQASGHKLNLNSF